VVRPLADVMRPLCMLPARATRLTAHSKRARSLVTRRGVPATRRSASNLKSARSPFSVQLPVPLFA
jgi:hypothetical protein